MIDITQLGDAIKGELIYTRSLNHVGKVYDVYRSFMRDSYRIVCLSLTEPNYHWELEITHHFIQTSTHSEIIDLIFMDNHYLDKPLFKLASGYKV